ncbi:ArsR/SmtB family transcription factor [Pseudoroseicyclus tamaricis]|uniref:Winged helix-turn-helix transcriptional regulator n=1 Tax=Pseudoroseicyclus tamaricis TaxID=2705421 RepID=A0A6B2K3A9_9RHOB|nr:metalloregulator ArsR/SmtB family transcription factor [Pseudoroseicyclus tamaricis]NDV01016.1 winged helix-turn-helix transcriptional regulator [Pseudoroseicyclus tamaricis]
MTNEAATPGPAESPGGAIAALADPTRRALVERLRAGPLAVGALAEGLPVSRPAVSQHLKVLSGAGLVEARAEGTRRIYGLSPEGVARLRAYFETLWADAFAGFAAAAQAEAARKEDNS